MLLERFQHNRVQIAAQLPAWRLRLGAVVLGYDCGLAAERGEFCARLVAMNDCGAGEVAQRGALR
jgi:hypothetical protein